MLWSRGKQPKSTLALFLTGLAVLMFGFSFALVPLYDLMCDALGIGRVTQAEAQHSVPIPDSRPIDLEFIATNTNEPSLNFYPLVKSMQVMTSQTYQVNFLAKNHLDVPVTVQAIPSVTPVQGTQYLIKTQCFCFEQQTLQPGESIKMPVVFMVDPGIPDRYSTLTLAYALFEWNGEAIAANQVR